MYAPRRRVWRATRDDLAGKLADAQVELAAAQDQAEAASTRAVAAVETEQEMPASPGAIEWASGRLVAVGRGAARLQGARWLSCFSAMLSQRPRSFGYLGICSLSGMTSDMERIECLLFGVPAALNKTENKRPTRPSSLLDLSPAMHGPRCA